MRSYLLCHISCCIFLTHSNMVHFFSLIILSKPKSSHPSYEFQQENTNPKTPILSDDWSVDNLEWDANSVLFSFRSKSGTAPSILAFGPVMSGFRLH